MHAAKSLEKLPFNSKGQSFPKMAFRRLSEILDVPVEKLEPKIYRCYDEKTPKQDFDDGSRLTDHGMFYPKKYSVILYHNSKSTEAHEATHAINYLLMKPRKMKKDGWKCTGTWRDTGADTKLPFVPKVEFYAYALSYKNTGATGLRMANMVFNNLFVCVPILAVQIANVARIVIMNIERGVSIDTPPVKSITIGVYSAIAGLYAATFAFYFGLSSHFHKQCGKYGIDGYLAALSHSISPFKIRKGLAKLEKEGMLRKGEGFTEKGKEELLGMKAEILEYAARKEKVVS